jgi:hypothetical protein
MPTSLARIMMTFPEHGVVVSIMSNISSADTLL